MGKTILGILPSLLQKPKELLEEELLLRREISCRHTHPAYPNILIGHTAFIPCPYVEETALGITKWVWERLISYEPSLAPYQSAELEIQLIKDPQKHPGGWLNGQPCLYANLVAGGEAPPKLADTLCEELYHFLEWKVTGVIPPFFVLPRALLAELLKDYPREVIRYAVQPHEYRAGKAAKEIVAEPERVKLWEAVERFRTEHGLILES